MKAIEGPIRGQNCIEYVQMISTTLAQLKTIGKILQKVSKFFFIKTIDRFHQNMYKVK